MNNLQIFNNNEFGEIRTTKVDGKPYLMLADVCKVLEIKNVSDVKSRLNDKGVVTTDTLTNGGIQQATFINESNFYKVVFQSRKPQAEKFTEWVTSEVLPSIRQSGGYILNQENMTPEQIVANALIVAQNIIKEKELQLEQANQVIEIQKPKAHAWDKLMDSKSNMNMSQVAKAFSIPGLGRNNLLKLLRDKKILRDNNEPYQSQLDNGRFTTVLTEKNGYTYSVTVMTPKGLKWLAGQLVEWGYIS